MAEEKPKWLLDDANINGPNETSLHSVSNHSAISKLKIRLLLLCKESHIHKDTIINDPKKRAVFSVSAQDAQSIDDDILEIYIRDPLYARKLATVLWPNYKVTWETTEKPVEDKIYYGLIKISGHENIVKVLLEEFQVPQFDLRQCLIDLELAYNSNRKTLYTECIVNLIKLKNNASSAAETPADDDSECRIL